MVTRAQLPVQLAAQEELLVPELGDAPHVAAAVHLLHELQRAQLHVRAQVVAVAVRERELEGAARQPDSFSGPARAPRRAGPPAGAHAPCRRARCRRAPSRSGPGATPPARTATRARHSSHRSGLEASSSRPRGPGPNTAGPTPASTPAQACRIAAIRTFPSHATGPQWQRCGGCPPGPGGRRRLPATPPGLPAGARGAAHDGGGTPGVSTTGTARHGHALQRTTSAAAARGARAARAAARSSTVAGRAGHQVGALLRLRERDHVAQATRRR